MILHKVHKNTFKWKTFKGSPEALKWNCRDLTSIDEVLTLVPGRTAVVQAGGHLGVFAKYLARVFASVLTFEPSADLFPKMTANAPEPNIIRIQAALGETPGLVGTACTRRDQTGKPVHEGLTYVVADGIIPTLRLDDFMLPVLDLLYLDLEGFELYALRGAVQTIARCRPVLSVEINRNIEFAGFTRDDVREFIVAQGYRNVSRVKSDEVFVPVEAAE